MEPNLPAIVIGVMAMGSFGLLMSGIAAIRQANLNHKLFKLRVEQIQRERQERD